MRRSHGPGLLRAAFDEVPVKAAAIAAATAVLLWSAGTALAQTPVSSHGHVAEAVPAEAPGHGPGMPGPGGMGGGPPAMGPMMGMAGGGGMMCPMAPMMGAMPMMMGGGGDPKTLGRMLQLHGEMMRAVGDVLLKHGKALEGSGK